jgi:probable HAF family extracellular repeat protein
MIGRGTLGGDESRAAAIADDGTIVGWSNLVTDGPPHAFLRDPVAGVLEDIGTLPG